MTREIKRLALIRSVGLKRDFSVAQNMQNLLLNIGSEYRRTHKKSGGISFGRK